jgi:hypothetical protein
VGVRVRGVAYDGLATVQYTGPLPNRQKYVLKKEMLILEIAPQCPSQEDKDTLQ